MVSLLMSKMTFVHLVNGQSCLCVNVLKYTLVVNHKKIKTLCRICSNLDLWF